MTAVEKKEVSAIGYSIVANVVDDVQMTFQHFVAADAPDAQVNADLDRIFGLIDRQRQLLGEPKARKELIELRASVAQYAQDLEKVEVDWHASQDGLREQIAKLEAKAAEAHERGYNDHMSAGKQGEYKPRGSTEGVIKGCAADIARIHMALEQNVNERGVARQQLEIAMKAREGRIAILEAQLADIAALKEG